MQKRTISGTKKKIVDITRQDLYGLMVENDSPTLKAVLRLKFLQAWCVSLNLHNNTNHSQVICIKMKSLKNDPSIFGQYYVP